MPSSKHLFPATGRSEVSLFCFSGTGRGSDPLTTLWNSNRTPLLQEVNDDSLFCHGFFLANAAWQWNTVGLLQQQTSMSRAGSPSSLCEIWKNIWSYIMDMWCVPCVGAFLMLAEPNLTVLDYFLLMVDQKLKEINFKQNKTQSSDIHSGLCSLKTEVQFSLIWPVDIWNKESPELWKN